MVPINQSSHRYSKGDKLINCFYMCYLMAKDNKLDIYNVYINLVSHLPKNNAAKYKVQMNGNLSAVMC